MIPLVESDQTEGSAESQNDVADCDGNEDARGQKHTKKAHRKQRTSGSKEQATYWLHGGSCQLMIGHACHTHLTTERSNSLNWCNLSFSGYN